tara:strand:+ start:957 stop:1184 length:228 start_codon:yes stop_codon:yes gene_type:complete
MSKKIDQSSKLDEQNYPLEEIQKRINYIESYYYKGSSQTEEWWRVTGDVNPTDRSLWIYYQGLKNKREKENKGDK